MNLRVSERGVTMWNKWANDVEDRHVAIPKAWKINAATHQEFAVATFLIAVVWNHDTGHQISMGK